jgi:hypothetical protein
MIRSLRYLLAIATVSIALGCASQGPVVPKPPSVSVIQLIPVSIDPQVVRFEAKIFIQNNMPVSLEYSRTDWGVDLFDTPLFSDSFTAMKRTSGGGNETVTFPFQIAMKDILDLAPDVLTADVLRVTFHGEVYPVGSFDFDAIPFAKSIQVPIPRVPEVSFMQAEGAPLGSSFTVTLLVKNTNSFSITVDSIDSYIQLNGKRYRLLRSTEPADLRPAEAQPIVLRLDMSPGKTLGMMLNLAQPRIPDFSVGGTIACSSRYGRFFVPLDVDYHP